MVHRLWDKQDRKDNDIGHDHRIRPTGRQRPQKYRRGSRRKCYGFTDYGTSKVGKITASGTVTEYALPSGSEPQGITTGPEGKLWFTDYGTSKIGTFSPDIVMGVLGAHDTKTIYYTTAANTGIHRMRRTPSNGRHLPCEDYAGRPTPAPVVSRNWR